MAAADFEPWNAVAAPNGLYYGYANDAVAPGGLIYTLRPVVENDPRSGLRVSTPETRIAYRFPTLPESPRNRLQGNLPQGSLAVGQDGAIYGRFSKGGVFAAGMIFRWDRGILQTIHHVERPGIARDLIVAKSGEIYSATMPADPAASGWVLRISKEGSVTNISAPPGEITCLGETSDQRIILGTWMSATGLGALWRLNSTNQFEQLSDLGSGMPQKLLALETKDILCATNFKIVRVSPAGTITELANSPGKLTTFLLYKMPDGATAYAGSYRQGFNLTDHYRFKIGPFPKAGDGILSPFEQHFADTSNWMDAVFRLRVYADRHLSALGPFDPGNRPPIARDEIVSAGNLKIGPTWKRQVTIPVLANDSDADQNPLKLVSVASPYWFDTEIQVRQQAGAITYLAEMTPVQNRSFTYTITDGIKTATARVFIRTNPAGRYRGDVLPVLPSEPDAEPAQSAGSLVVNLGADRALVGRLDFEGKVYPFTGRLNAYNQCAAVLMLNPLLDQSLAIQLVLRPNGHGWVADAVIQKDNTAQWTASCVVAAP
jgi:hypothetical protein